MSPVAILIAAGQEHCHAKAGNSEARILQTKQSATFRTQSTPNLARRGVAACQPLPRGALWPETRRASFALG